jgi:streptogramin lyase
MSRSILFICTQVTLIAGLSGLAVAQQTSYTLTEWNTPTTSSEPLHVAVVSPTQFYFTENSKNRIGETNVNLLTEWLLPQGSMPHGIVMDDSNMLAFCAFGQNYLGVMDPTQSTLQLTQYTVPTPASGIIHLDTMISPEGLPQYFFSEATANNIGLLDPNAPLGPTFTEWPVPTPSSTPRGVAIGTGPTGDVQVFFAELSTHQIGMLDMTAGTMTEWLIPSVRQVEHLHLANGLVYFGDLATSVVGTLDPISGTINEWIVPTANANIPDLLVSGTNFYFSERAGNNVGFLNTSTQAPSNRKILKAKVTQVTPKSTVVQASLAVTVPSKQTTMQPTITTITGLVTGAFTEWPLPNAGSGPLGMGGSGSTVVFAEFYGNRVATLAPTVQQGPIPKLTSGPGAH